MSRLRTAAIATVALAVVLIASGCTGAPDPVQPTPATTGVEGSASPTSTPLPRAGRQGGAPAVDPRCLARFPDRAEIIDEAQVPGRPDFWPPVPPWAVLCFTELENDFTQVGWYATDPGTSRAEIYRYYEHGIMGVGDSARVAAPEGEIVTGVVLPDHSFWLLAGRDHYRVTWSQDGEYAS